MRKYDNVFVGNVYAIETSIGYGLFQCVAPYVATRDPGIDVVRVLQTVIRDINAFMPQLLEEKERYYTQMIVCEAERRKLITLIGNFPLPKLAKAPKKYRRLEYVPHRNIRDWYIIDAKTLKMKIVPEITDEFLRLSSSAIWNVAYLRERIEEDWRLEDWR